MNQALREHVKGLQSRVPVRSALRLRAAGSPPCPAPQATVAVRFSGPSLPGPCRALGVLGGVGRRAGSRAERCGAAPCLLPALGLASLNPQPPARPRQPLLTAGSPLARGSSRCAGLKAAHTSVTILFVVTVLMRDSSCPTLSDALGALQDAAWFHSFPP